MKKTVTHKQVVNAINESIAAERKIIALTAAQPSAVLVNAAANRKYSAATRDIIKRELKFRATHNTSVLLGIDPRREGK